MWTWFGLRAVLGNASIQIHLHPEQEGLHREAIDLGAFSDPEHSFCAWDFDDFVEVIKNGLGGAVAQ